MLSNFEDNGKYDGNEEHTEGTTIYEQQHQQQRRNYKI